MFMRRKLIVKETHPPHITDWGVLHNATKAYSSYVGFIYLDIICIYTVHYEQPSLSLKAGLGILCACIPILDHCTGVACLRNIK